ncbi:MAG: BBP7 family outer membrane beta-barrel protein [Thermoguttaceae bacterium]
MDSRRLFGTVLFAIFVLSTSAAAVLGRNDAAADSAMTGDGEGSLPSFSATTDDPSQCAGRCDADFGQSCRCPRWTASAEFMGWFRVGGVNQALVTTYPVTPPPPAVNPPFVPGTGTERLNSQDLNQSFAAGPKVDLTYHGDYGYDVELSFFEIDGWNSAGIVLPNGQSPSFAAPGGFIQTTDTATQAMGWEYATRLYNAELNARWALCPRVTMLAGFRWVELWENLQGILTPPALARKNPFWTTTTENDLYGFQIGEDWKIFERGRFSLDGLVKAGMFDNNAAETTGVSIYRRMYWESDATNQLAFLGEIGLEAEYQLAQRLLLKAGYQAIWLQGVALAPGQISKTFSNGDPGNTSVQALGVDSGSGVFFHGATAGLEYAF